MTSLDTLIEERSVFDESVLSRALRTREGNDDGSADVAIINSQVDTQVAAAELVAKRTSLIAEAGEALRVTVEEQRTRLAEAHEDLEAARLAAEHRTEYEQMVTLIRSMPTVAESTAEEARLRATLADVSASLEVEQQAAAARLRTVALLLTGLTDAQLALDAEAAAEADRSANERVESMQTSSSTGEAAVQSEPEEGEEDGEAYFPEQGRSKRPRLLQDDDNDDI
mmetsp:Transcript_6283/g.20495  ORF Transcript_6283/g.20495 Transcript_6283/m.20495 type:complete len:226 (-) Transcript_6283:84-761(-)|eukprot:CAMPEP_0170742290 /NCGR_PEP_ID=MMETSP0437-20130122/6666_1 /TAXON_ID=0 /ORGANISM="Sexangularia sp." /LENGTH=225 /DNA_ID=CAMNT_0011080903 /DNA_START=51 /DNA_END=728 /DNA_ORIENTATION=-